MKTIGIFYGPAGGSSTEKVAYKVAKQIRENNVNLIPVDEDFEAHLTDERIRKWLDKILPEFI